MSVQDVKTKPYLVGLTGGIASGKTTVSHLFLEEGVSVIDSDQIVKDLWKTDINMVDEIEQAFGYPMNLEGKKKLAKDIFRDEKKRQILNHIIHPRVFHVIEQEKMRLKGEKIIIIDMPLLIEVGYQDKVDEVLLVYVDEPTQIMRLMKRDGISKDEALAKIQSQMSLEDKKAYADVVVNNQQDITSLHAQVKSFLKQRIHEE